MLPFLRRSLLLLLPLSLLSTVYLYCYPYILGCAFTPQVAPANTSFWTAFKHFWSSSTLDDGAPAPFRLLALGDPQLEGDSSLPNPEHGYLPSLNTLQSDVLEASTTRDGLDVLGKHTLDLIIVDIPRLLHYFRKRLDLIGNDYYLAHIYRTLHQALEPTHVTVLGDLIGSQWVTDEEFERRAWRFWNRVFKHGVRVDDDITEGIHLGPLGQDKSWEQRIINIAGNHDIGYAGDITTERMERFEKAFGRANWETRFTISPNSTIDPLAGHLEELPELRIIVLNDLNLDTPAYDEDIQGNTYRFINDAIGLSRPVEDRTSATLLLTHVPMHKKEGVCVDGPYFSFHDEEYGGGLREQNHLSYNAARGIMEGIYGMSGNPNAPGQGFGRNGIILTGHDHEGCDVYHHLPDHEDNEARKWKAEIWANSTAKEDRSIPGIRVVTVRRMMGEFGGNAGLLSAWYDVDTGVWRFEYSTCAVGTQHIWWGVHILDIITVSVLLLLFVNFISTPPVPKPAEVSPLKLRKRANTLDAWLQTANPDLKRDGSRRSTRAMTMSGMNKPASAFAQRTSQPVDNSRRSTRAMTMSGIDNPGPAFGARRPRPMENRNVT